MQPRELEKQVFSHRVVYSNGFEKIVPTSELDPNVQSRVLTMLEARKIIAALTGLRVEQVEVPMFHPLEMAVPAETNVAATEVIANNDPGQMAKDAAKSISALNEQFAIAA